VRFLNKRAILRQNGFKVKYNPKYTQQFLRLFGQLSKLFENSAQKVKILGNISKNF